LDSPDYTHQVELTNNNRLDFVRLVAAYMVLFSHSFPLFGLTWEPLGFTGAGSTGELAVLIFFIISGFLITASYQNSPNVFSFILNRMLRLIPALAFVVLLSICVLGPILTTLPVHEYFNHTGTWKYLRNILIYPQMAYLPGVFEGLPHPGAVNGALWTLRIEFTMYLAVPILSFFGLLHPKRIWWVVAAFWVLFVHYLNKKNPPIYFFMESVPLFKFGFVYMVGAAFYVCRKHIPMKLEYALLGAGLFIGSLYTPFAMFGMLIFLAYPLLYFGLRPRFAIKIPDISYGVYIFAFPLQQSYMWYIGSMKHLIWFPLTVAPVVTLCAIISWYLVERPALRLKRFTMHRVEK
jgi:peptidoglycan/LPS O-acetylase OafA/YrhL